MLYLILTRTTMSKNPQGKNIGISSEDFIKAYNKYPDKKYGFRAKIAKDLGICRTTVTKRIKDMQNKGLLPLDTGVLVGNSETLKGTSTLYKTNEDTGKMEPTLQWVKTDVEKETFLEQFEAAIKDISNQIPAMAKIRKPKNKTILDDDLITLYISNDIHFGALMWDKESGDDWNLDLALKTVEDSYDYLFETSPSSKVAIISDLGDLLEADNDKNVTPKSGNVLATDSRYAKVLRAAYEALIYAVTKALQKHELVYFYNIAGNHDMTTGHAIREIIYQAFKDNPRVIVDCKPSVIKYHHHNELLLQFAHGDGMKMKDAGEVMAHDCQEIFSSTKYRFSHFGHNHKDSVHDGRLCRVESHRNLAPLNNWAYAMGYRSSPGTMKSITYHGSKGEISRSTYNL